MSGSEGSAIQTVTMPKWGLSMKSGKVVAWLVEEGEEITPGMDLADIETEKIAGTLESAQEGVLRRIIARTGTDVPVSGVIAVVAPAGVPEADIDAVVAKAQQDLAAGLVEEQAGPTQASVQAGGRTICYATLGEGDQVIVLVHGYGGDKNSWLFLIEPLAAGPGGEGGRRVYALDLPGHGESSKDVGDGSLDVLAGAVLDALDALGIDAAHLVGHSLGGAVVSTIALRAPSRVRSLTLVAPVGFGTDIDADYLRGFADAGSRRELRPLLARLFADEEQVTRQLIDDVLKYKRLDGVDAALHALVATVLIDGWAGSQQAIDIAGRLAGTDLPVAVVWGSADRIVPVPGTTVGRWLVHLVEGSGHMVHMESPHAVRDVIEEVVGPPAGS